MQEECLLKYEQRKYFAYGKAITQFLMSGPIKKMLKMDNFFFSTGISIKLFTLCTLPHVLFLITVFHLLFRRGRSCAFVNLEHAK